MWQIQYRRAIEIGEERIAEANRARLAAEARRARRPAGDGGPTGLRHDGRALRETVSFGLDRARRVGSDI